MKASAQRPHLRLVVANSEMSTEERIQWAIKHHPSGKDNTETGDGPHIYNHASHQNTEPVVLGGTTRW